MTRRWALALALMLAGCGVGPRPEMSFLLPMVEGAPASPRPLPVAAVSAAPESKPLPSPSPWWPNSPGSGGGSRPAPVPGEVGISIETGDRYALVPVAGEAAAGFEVGTSPETARFGAIAGLAVAPGGTIFACDPIYNQVRAIAPGRPAEVVAGDVGGAAGYYGDNVPAVGTRLNGPTGLARDPVSGALFVADSGNGRVRMFTPGGRMYTFAGGGSATTDTVNAATSARLQQPHGLAIDHQRRLYLTDRATGKVRCVEADGKLTTVATLAANQVGAIAASADGQTLWVAEGARVYALRPGATPVTPTVVYEATGAVVTALATDQAGSLFVLETAASPFGRSDTRLWRVPLGLPGRPPVMVAGVSGAGAAPEDYVAPAAGVPDATLQRLAGASETGLAIDLFEAGSPDVPSGVLYQANTYADGALRWGQVNRLTPAI